jgi:hypothetical protein
MQDAEVHNAFTNVLLPRSVSSFFPTTLSPKHLAHPAPRSLNFQVQAGLASMVHGDVPRAVCVARCSAQLRKDLRCHVDDRFRLGVGPLLVLLLPFSFGFEKIELILSLPRLARLGDRHCENTLYDSNNGDTVHVDLNCLFEKVRSSALIDVLSRPSSTDPFARFTVRVEVSWFPKRSPFDSPKTSSMVSESAALRVSLLPS